MATHRLLACLFVAVTLLHAQGRAQAPPADWIDPATGHRLIRLSGEGGGSSLYFHQNTYNPKGDKLVFDTRAGIAVVDLTNLGKEPVKAEVVVPGARAISTAWRTPDVYYRKSGALYATNLETKAERKVTDARGSVVNADETLVIGFERDAEAPAKVKELGLPMLVTADLVDRSEPPGRLRHGGRSLALVVTDIKTGAARKIHYSTEWLNHLQASPADPNRILFCHEGAWHQVDRVWTIRADGKELKLMHKRTMQYEIAGHEFFSYDGKWVWYDLQTPRSKEFWLAGVNIETGERMRYPIAREHWSVHFNISRDGKLFAGDGGGPGSVANLTPLPERKTLDPPGNGQWIYLFTPAGAPAESIHVGGETVQVGKLVVERLVDLSKHNYSLEPNVTITPDNKWVVFRSNMHGPTHVYAVEVATGPMKAAQAQPNDEKKVERTEQFPAPPKGFDSRRDGIERGKLETVEYDSTTVGVKRKAQVYTPPGYSPDNKYPVLYLLHGIGGDENEWTRGGAADVVLDNLYADKQAVPMIVVLPNGRASKDMTRRDPIPKQSPAFAAFEKDLLIDLIPFIEKTYSVKADRGSRALAGLSMGGGQSLNFGLTHLETFAWVGGFSSAPNTKKADELLKDPADATKQHKLLWISCGDRDGLLRSSRGLHKALDEQKVPHIWHVHLGGGHDFAVWKADLYHFAPLLFR